MKSISILGKKELMLRLLWEVKDFQGDLQEELENEQDYDDPEIQEYLYWLSHVMREFLVLTKKLRERHDRMYQNDVMSLVLNTYLQRIDELWKDRKKTGP